MTLPPPPSPNRFRPYMRRPRYPERPPFRRGDWLRAGAPILAMLPSFVQIFS